MEMKGTHCRQIEEQQTQKVIFPLAYWFASHHRLHFLYPAKKEMLHHPTLSQGHPKGVPSANGSTE